MESSHSSLAFRVIRREPELVAPAKPTPRELKQLSDIDDQESFRFHTQTIQFYGCNPSPSPSVRGRDPVMVIREALGEALVFYYPFAGRLREVPRKKLMVDCTGEGVMFVEADADVTIGQFGDPLRPPFPCLEELLFNVPGSDGILNCPLLLIQVTRLKCGGFVLALRLNHTICDATGLVRFLNAVAEMAQGADAPSILPSWERQLLNARDPPRVTCSHNEYNLNNEIVNNEYFQIETCMIHRCFLLGPDELSIIRQLAPSNIPHYTRFEILTACLWQCYAEACREKLFSSGEDVLVPLKIAVDARRYFDPPLSKGYYGNVVAHPVAVTSTRNLLQNPLSGLGHAMDLLRNAKARITEEYMRSTADLMVMEGRPPLVQSYNVTDLTRIGFDSLDYGWGKPVYGGPPKAWISDHIPGAAAFCLPFNNNKVGEPGIMVLVSLHKSIMERFALSLKKLLKK